MFLSRAFGHFSSVLTRIRGDLDTLDVGLLDCYRSNLLCRHAGRMSTVPVNVSTVVEQLHRRLNGFVPDLTIWTVEPLWQGCHGPENVATVVAVARAACDCSTKTKDPRTGCSKKLGAQVADTLKFSRSSDLSYLFPQGRRMMKSLSFSGSSRILHNLVLLNV